MRIYPQTFVIFITLFIGNFSFAQIAFSDISNTVGTLQNGGFNIGVSICDYNQDNLEDFYVVCRTGPNHFYKTKSENL